MTLNSKQLPPSVLEVCEALRCRNFEAYIVGGAVRDLLLDREPHDWDVATNATPDQVMKIFGSSFSIPTGLQHGTVTVFGHSKLLPVEVTTYRTEATYSDGRHPDSVKFAKTIQEDLSRRDFTMNAIAYDPIANVIVDPQYGQVDITNKVVRAVGNPKARFEEDGLRSIRAVRQAAQLGFYIEDHTYHAISELTPMTSFDMVSRERVRDELLKLLVSEYVYDGIWNLLDSGLLLHSIPELVAGYGMPQNKYHKFDVFRHTQTAVGSTINEPAKRGIWRLGALLHDVGKPATRAPKENAPGEFSFHNHENVGAEMAADICSRLKLSGDDRDTVVNMVKHHMFDYNSDWTDATVRRFIRKVGPEMLQPLYALRYGDRMGKGFANEHPETEISEIKSRVEKVSTDDAAFSIKDLKINGSEVIEILQCKPSKVVGDTLSKLLERVLDKPELNVNTTLRDLVKEVQ